MSSEDQGNPAETRELVSEAFADLNEALAIRHEMYTRVSQRGQ